MPPNAKPPDVPPALAKALHLHQQGKLAEAERLYADILAAGTSAEARSLMTLLNHGRVHNALGRRDEALHRFEEAIALQPKLAEAHMSRGAAFASLEDFLDRAARQPTGTPA
jgi:tetratricopeptide (TPR) repeat protein